MAHCHANEIVHGDLKPENFVFVDRRPPTAIHFYLATYKKEKTCIIKQLFGIAAVLLSSNSSISGYRGATSRCSHYWAHW